MKCLNCGNEEISEKDNFCIICGKKLKKTCVCWVKKQDNYDCGKDSCPGYGLFQKNQSPRDDFASSQPKSITN